MIDFVEQKQKTPVSFKLFETWVEKNYDTTLNIWNGTIRNEDVLLWLDEHSVFVNVRCTAKYTTCSIVQELSGIQSTLGIGSFVSRSHATSRGIKKGFDLLEDKLKKN